MHMCNDNENDKALFPYYEYSWSTSSSNDSVIDLKPGGRDVPVKWEEREEYIKAVEKHRLSEFKEQVEHIRKGLATIVPVHLLSLFTWQELELNVCGRNEIKISFLKENTRYQSGFLETDEHVLLLWQVLESFSHKQRELFLRFVWGRSRLPLNVTDFTQKFVVLSSRTNSDETLPVSHTCFFQLELPRYSCLEVMRKKILYAITECRAIDTDHRAADLDWDAD